MAHTLGVIKDDNELIIKLIDGIREDADGDAELHQPQSVQITVPKYMVAFVSGELTVNHWGYIDIICRGEVHRVIHIAPESEEGAPVSSHARRTAKIGEPVKLMEGQHTFVVHRDPASLQEGAESRKGVNLAINYKRVNLMKRTEAMRWIEAYRPVDYEMMRSPDQVYEYVGGELLYLHKSDPDYWDSCALRVSIALSTLGIDYRNAQGAVKYSNVMHLYDGYAILGANNMTNFFTQMFGSATYKSLEDYMKEREDQDILVLGGKLPGGQAHVGFALGNDPGMMGSFTNMVWVLNRISWPDPD